MHGAYCVLFAHLPKGKCHGGRRLGKLITKPFEDFKNVKGKEGVLDKYGMYQYHVLMGKSFWLDVIIQYLC